MERRVSVNGKVTSERPRVTPDGLPQGWAADEWPEDDDPLEQEDEGPAEGSAGTAPELGRQGPCLYLGSAGERCNRPALPGGFCDKHRAGQRSLPMRNPARILAVAGAIVALLWPYVEDVVHEIFRWMHSH